MWLCLSYRYWWDTLWQLFWIYQFELMCDCRSSLKIFIFQLFKLLFQVNFAILAHCVRIVENNAKLRFVTQATSATNKLPILKIAFRQLAYYKIHSTSFLNLCRWWEIKPSPLCLIDDEYRVFAPLHLREYNHWGIGLNKWALVHCLYRNTLIT